MESLSEVERAKTLMLEAMGWSVMKWLREKKRVRKSADLANAALDQRSETLKQNWPADMKAAYANLAAPANGCGFKSGAGAGSSKGSKAHLLATKIKKAEDEAFRARMSAEQTFDDAEKKLSTMLAREGCRKAIYAWELQQEVIHQTGEIGR